MSTSSPEAKRRKFAEAYVEHGNASKAAVQAGYSAKSATSAASRLLKHPEVAHAIAVARKQAPPAVPPAELASLTPMEYLLGVMRDPSASISMRIQAAKIAAPFCHPKAPSITQKEAQEAARKAALAGSKFVPAKPPARIAYINPQRQTQAGSPRVIGPSD